MNIKGVINPGCTNKIINLALRTEAISNYLMDGNLYTVLRITFENESPTNDRWFLATAYDIQKSDWGDGKEEVESVKAIGRFKIEKMANITPMEIYPVVRLIVEQLNQKILSESTRLQDCHHVHDCPELSVLQTKIATLIEELA